MKCGETGVSSVLRSCLCRYSDTGHKMKKVVWAIVLVVIPITSSAETPKQEATRVCTEYVRIKKLCYNKATKGILPTNGIKGIKSNAPKDLIEISCHEGFEAFEIAGRLKQVELNRTMLVSFNKCYDDFLSFIPRRSCFQASSTLKNAKTEMEMYYADNQTYPKSIPNINKISISGVKLSMTCNGQTFYITSRHPDCDTIYEASNGFDGVRPASEVSEQKNTPHKGQILSRMNSNGYTFAKIVEGGNEVWVAFPQREVKIGDTIEFTDDPPMINFESKSLNMTFDKIIFAPNIKVHAGG